MIIRFVLPPLIIANRLDPVGRLSLLSFTEAMGCLTEAWLMILSFVFVLRFFALLVFRTFFFESWRSVGITFFSHNSVWSGKGIIKQFRYTKAPLPFFLFFWALLSLCPRDPQEPIMYFPFWSVFDSSISFWSASLSLPQT